MQFPGSEPDVAVLETFAGAVNSLWNANIAPLASTSVELNQCNVTDLSSDSAPAVEVATGLPGTRDGAGLSADASMVASILIPRRYRGGHPRNYWPLGIQSDLEDPQHWTSAFVTACETGIGEFLGEITTSGWPDSGTLNLVNVSYYNGFTAVENPLTGRYRNVPTVRGTPLVDTSTGLRANPYVGSQRRRQHPR
jgi:hypothetical protein